MLVTVIGHAANTALRQPFIGINDVERIQIFTDFISTKNTQDRLNGLWSVKFEICV